MRAAYEEAKKQGDLTAEGGGRVAARAEMQQRYEDAVAEEQKAKVCSNRSYATIPKIDAFIGLKTH